LPSPFNTGIYSYANFMDWLNDLFEPEPEPELNFWMAEWSEQDPDSHDWMDDWSEEAGSCDWMDCLSEEGPSPHDSMDGLCEDLNHIREEEETCHLSTAIS
jgi:hypothetical protein